MNRPINQSSRRTWACFLAPFILLGTCLLVGWAGGQLCYRTLLATPTSLPAIPGARQLTRPDLALYTNLAWSPSGKYLTADRHILTEADPLSIPLVLVDVKSGSIFPISFEEFTPYPVSYEEYYWSPDSDRLLLEVKENFPYGTAVADQQPHLESEYYIFDFANNSLQMLSLPSGISAFGWHKHDPNLLWVMQWASENGTQTYTYAWYDIRNGEMQSFFTDEKGRWPLWLSDDGTKLLTLELNPGSFSEQCGDIYFHPIDTTEGFSLLLPSTCGIAWSRDGSRMAYTSYSDSSSNNLRRARLMLANGDGSNPQPFFADENLTGFYSVAWSPDGKQIAFSFHSGQVLDKDYATGIYIADVPAKWQP